MEESKIFFINLEILRTKTSLRTYLSEAIQEKIIGCTECRMMDVDVKKFCVQHCMCTNVTKANEI